MRCAGWSSAAVGLYLALILWGFDTADPGWSHAARVERIANPGGRFGAWLADLLLYLFGLSAWWWVALLFFLVAWGYRRAESRCSAATAGRCSSPWPASWSCWSPAAASRRCASGA